jgi:outer membrane protein assembly factor BamB
MKSRVFATFVIVLTGVALAACGGARRSIDEIFNFTGTKTKIQGERIAIILSDQQLAPDPQLANVKMELPAPKMNTEWTEPGGSPSNIVGNLMAAGPLAQIWSVSAGKGSDGNSRLTAPPIIAGGLVFVLDSEAHVFAFDAATGNAVWDKSLVPPADQITLLQSLNPFSDSRTVAGSKGFGGGIAFDTGRLYAATGFGTVNALDAKTGNEIWTAKTAVPVHSAPVVVDGRIYVITQDNQTVALNADNGQILWDHHGTVESAAILSSASVAVVGDTVVVPYSSGELFALRAQNGQPAWTDTLTRSGNTTALTVINDIAGRPVIDRNLVFAISHSGTLAAINFRSGSRAWTRNIAGIQTPLVVGDYLFIVSTEGQVVCMTRADGRVRWSTQLESYADAEAKRDPIVWTGPMLVSNFLVLVSSDGKATLLSPYTGQKLGDTEIPSGTFISPVVANGIMYVLTDEAELVALR